MREVEEENERKDKKSSKKRYILEVYRDGEVKTGRRGQIARKGRLRGKKKQLIKERTIKRKKIRRKMEGCAQGSVAEV